MNCVSFIMMMIPLLMVVGLIVIYFGAARSNAPRNDTPSGHNELQAEGLLIEVRGYTYVNKTTVKEGWVVPEGVAGLESRVLATEERQIDTERILDQEASGCRLVTRTRQVVQAYRNECDYSEAAGAPVCRDVPVYADEDDVGLECKERIYVDRPVNRTWYTYLETTQERSKLPAIATQHLKQRKHYNVALEYSDKMMKYMLEGLVDPQISTFVCLNERCTHRREITSNHFWAAVRMYAASATD